ncbi:MAG TPA: hypothetical protein VJU16_07615, partial [Planctomycetota bacterium]|nr:hypothetical protein [Planctomycetota bacterium]
MKRLILSVTLVAIGCGESSPPPPAPAAPAPVSVPALPKPAGGEALLEQAEKERSAALYDQASKAFTEALAADPKNAAAAEGRAIAKWRLSLMRGTVDPDVEKDLATAGDRPRAKALKALARLVEGARTGG